MKEERGFFFGLGVGGCYVDTHVDYHTWEDNSVEYNIIYNYILKSII